MTQEEKAKRYDEAIEKAKEYDPDLVGLSAGEILEDIFPELEESEDEKIRNQIIEHIKWSKDVGNCASEESQRWIAWLEKQGEQKPWSEEDGRMLQNILDCLRNGYTKLPSDILQIESWLKSLKDSCLPQPKQEWSDADEEELELATGTLLNAGQSSSAQWVEDLSERLKSLRPQKQWKPSDEQMKALYEETQESDRIRDVRIVSLYEDLKKLMEE